MKACLLFLTCRDEEEAHAVQLALLKKDLVICVKQIPVSSCFIWKKKIDSSAEVLLMMESIEENFENVEQEVKKIHSYKTFVLSAIPIIKLSARAKSWFAQELEHS